MMAISTRVETCGSKIYNVKRVMIAGYCRYFCLMPMLTNFLWQ